VETKGSSLERTGNELETNWKRDLENGNEKPLETPCFVSTRFRGLLKREKFILGYLLFGRSRFVWFGQFVSSTVYDELTGLD
jgi:hypothetical protein